MRAIGPAALHKPRSLWRLLLPMLAAIAIAAYAVFGGFWSAGATTTLTFIPGGNTTCSAQGYDNDLKVSGPNDTDQKSVGVAGTYAGTYSDGTLTVTISNVVENGDGDEAFFDWDSSTIPLDAVLVKSQGTNKYAYSPAVLSDDDLNSPENKNISHISFCYDDVQLVDLVVTKTVDASFDRTWAWQIEKTVSPETWSLFDGDTGTSEYTVTVTKGASTDSNYLVTGTITITNNNPVPVTVTSVTDSINGVPATVTGCDTPFDVPANSFVECSYNADEGDGLDGSEDENTATVEAEDDLGDSVTVDVDYDINEINDEATVSDTNDEFGDDDTIDSSETYTYSITLDCSALTDNDYVNGVASFTHENTATITGNNGPLGSDDASVDVTCYRLAIDKTVETSFIRTWNWDIEKSADPTELNMTNGQSGLIEYTIIVDKVDFTDSDFQVWGTITIENPHPTRAAEITSLIDELSTGESYDCGSDTVPAGGSITCDYSFPTLNVDNGDERENTATATQQNYDFDKDSNGTSSGTTDYDVTKDVIFSDTPLEEIHEQADLNDTMGGDLGTLDDDDTVSYEIEYFCDNDEGDHQNIATLTGEDLGNGPVQLDQDDATITVNCSELDPLSVTKTVEASYDQDYDWVIEKTVSPEVWDLFTGDSGTSEYTISATRSGPFNSGYTVSGTITIVNLNPVPVSVLSVVDTITPGDIDAQVTCPVALPHELEAFNDADGEDGDTLVCTYIAVEADGLDGGEDTNTVVVTTEQDVANGSDTQPVSYVVDQTTDASLTVDDTNGQSFPFDESGQETYTETFTCDADEGVHDNTITAQAGDQGELSDSASVTVNCYELTVIKTADTSYDRRFEWTIEKSADPTTHNLLVGESDTSEYTISVTKSDPIDENFAVEGTITLSNPHPSRAATLTGVSDLVSPGLAATVDCPSLSVPAGGTLECTYSLDLPNGDDRTNTATATLQNVSIDPQGVPTDTGTTGFSGDAAVTFGEPDTVTLDSINVVDSYGPAPDPWAFSDDGSVNYEREFFCTADDLNGQSAVVLQFDNTATIQETQQSDDATVIVNCSEQEALIVSKTVELEFDRTWEWDIEKNAVPTVHDLVNDETGVSDYTILVTQSGPFDSNWQISGVISITNPATIAATITGVSDVVTQAGFGNTAAPIVGCTVDAVDVGIPSAGSPVSLDPGDTMLCVYAAALPGGSDGTNVATVTTGGDVPGAGTAEDVDFDDAAIDETLAEVTVTDSYADAPDPWVFDSTNVVGYSRTFDCADVDFGDDNTASFVVDNTATITETGASDDADVTVDCTLVEEPGTIIITKQADPATAVTVFEFDGPGNLANDLQSGESNIETLPPGTYGIGENLAALGTQWLLDDIVCTSADGTSTFDENVPAGGVVIDLAAGDTVSCTFFNEQQPGVVIPEAPFAILFPIIGLLVAAGGYLFWRRRQHIGQAG